MNRYVSRFVTIFVTFTQIMPYAIGIFLALFGTLATGLLLTFHFEDGYLLVSGFVASCLSYYLCKKLISKVESTSSELVIFNGLILLGVLVWVIFNLSFTSQSVMITRDPALYTVGAKYLSQNNHSDYKVGDIGLPGNIAPTQSNGVWHDMRDPSGNTLQIQGMHLLPVLLASGARLIGEAAIYKTNVLFGGIAILLLYGCSKLFVKPKWAALGAGVFAVSLPLIYFSRDTYTEPLAAVLVLGTILWLNAAYRLNNPRYWFAVGLMAGSSTLVRPDAYLFIAALLITAIVFILINDNKLAYAKKSITYIVLGVIVPMIIGWLDLTELTRSYYHGHGADVRLQLQLLVLLIFVGVGILLGLKSKLFSKIIQSQPKYLVGVALALIIPFAGLVLMARPVVYKGISHKLSPALGQINIIQGRTGDPILARNYSEMTIQWISWYLGEALVLLGFIGLGIAAFRIYFYKDYKYLFAFIVLGITSALYLVSPHITPDQIWAMRRYLPIVIPGLIIFATIALELVVEKLVPDKLSKNKYGGTIIYVLIAGYFILQPLIISRPFIRATEKTDYAKAIHNMCDVVPYNALIIWLGDTLERDLVHTTRVYCGVESRGLTMIKQVDGTNTRYTIDEGKLVNIADKARSKGLQPYIALHGSQKPTIDTFIDTATISTYTTQELEQTVSSPPRDIFVKTDTIELGELTPEGKIIKPLGLQNR